MKIFTKLIMAPTAIKNIESSPEKNPLHKVQQPRHSVPYALFVHRQTLSITKAGSMRKAYSKLQLTEGLISNARKNALHCTPEDLLILSRESIYKNNLKRNIARMKFHQFMQLKKLKEQQKEQLKQEEQQPQPTDGNINNNIAMEDIPTTDEGLQALE